MLSFAEITWKNAHHHDTVQAIELQILSFTKMSQGKEAQV